MKKTRFLGVLLALLLVVLPLAGCSSNTTGTTDTTDTGAKTTGDKTIAVIAKGESHAFWQSVKAGAEDAGAKYGYKITFRGPASESAKDLPSQMEMVSTALTNGCDGLVLATIGEGYTDMLAQAKTDNIPVVQFDSGVWKADVDALDAQNKNPIVSSVATSNTAAAGLAAEKFFAAIKADIAASDKYVIGIIQHDETQTGIDRAGGFETKFKELADADAATKGKYVIEKEVKPGDADNAYKAALEALFEKGAKAIFMSNEGVVKQVSDAIGAAGNKYDAVKFCGFDAGTKQIEWMKKTGDAAKLIGAVAQDSYQIGYNAVEQCVNAIEGKTVEPNVGIAGSWWDSANVDEMIKSNIVYEG